MSFAVPLAFLSDRRRLLVLLTTLSILACRPSAPPQGVVAVTDHGEIRLTELEDHILSLPESSRRPPDGRSMAEWRRQMLEGMIAARALEAEARSRGLAETPEGRDFLASRVEPILVQTMGARLIEERVEVTEEDLRAYYDAHPEDFSHPEQIRVRNIFRRVARDAPPEVWETARQEIEGLLDEIRRGANFGDLARAHSDSETAPMAGLIGRLDRGKLDPALEEVLWSLGEGEVSEVLRTPVGYHIFKVEKHLERFKMDFEEARTRLLRRLTREATEATEEALLHELIEESGATYHPDLLMEGDDQAILFTLGDDSLTAADFLHHLNSIAFSTARDLSLRRQLDQAIRQRLHLWKAKDSGLADEPEIAALLEQVEREALIDLAAQDHRRALVDELKETDLGEFYMSRERRFQTPRLLHLRILTRDFPEERSWYAVYEELERLAGEIRAGRRDFSQSARELSTDFSAARGGDVGAIRVDSLAEWAGPAARNKVQELAIGELSEPILIERYNTNRLTYDRTGYMLVRLEGVEEPRMRPFEEVRDAVVEQYLEQGGEEIQRRVREKILRSVGTKIFEENL